MQKRNRAVDELKDKWAHMHGIPILRFWEYDIKNNPQKVIDELCKYVHIEKKKKRIMKLK